MAGLIGVFGGTFDPPHIGHLILADEARVAFELRTVLWVLTPVPPHKPSQPISSIDDRRRMVESTIAGNPHFQLSGADIERPAPHFSIGTMKWLIERYPEDRFAYLMGSDSLMDLPEWHQPNAFLDTIDMIGVMKREGEKVDIEELESAIPGISRKVKFFNAPIIEISSTEIRARVVSGKPFRYLVPRAVADIIESKGLYL